MYAILDIEGTGGKFNEESITEVAIYRFDGHDIVDQFASLVNPEKPIDPYVTKLTGINNKMLVRAPKFYEIAKRVVEITKDCVIVAHNADFDLRMLQLEFDRLGFEFNSTTLCTVELSQKLLPDLESYSLGKLVRSLGIPITDRHRATGDALATVKLFQLLLAKDTNQTITRQSLKRKERTYLPKNLKELVDSTPSITGTYTFYDKENKAIFIGKSKNTKSQVNRHFTKETRLNKTLIKHVENIVVEKTGNELIAALKEHEYIKKLSPIYNRKRRGAIFNHGLIISEDVKGIKHGIIERTEKNKEYVLTFTSKKAGMSFLEKWYLDHELSFFFSNLEEPHPDQQFINTENIDIEHHNAALQNLITRFSLASQDGFIKTRGRVASEHGIVWIKDGIVMGYGFTTLKFQIMNKDILNKIITNVQHKRDARHIVEQYMRSQKRYKLQEL